MNTTKCIIGYKQVINKAPIGEWGTTYKYYTVRVDGVIIFTANSFEEACNFAANYN